MLVGKSRLETIQEVYGKSIRGRVVVCIESPYAGNTKRNLLYAQRCLLHSLQQGEAPFASHLLYTQVLDDKNETHREAGLTAGDLVRRKCDLVAVYCDLGVTPGMVRGIQDAKTLGKPIEVRWLEPETE